MKFKKGDIAWVHDSDAGWVRVEIIKVRGNYCNVKRIDRAAAFGASGHRLLTEEEYLKLNPNVQPQEDASRPPLFH